MKSGFCFLTIFIFSLVCIGASAQDITFNKVLPPEGENFRSVGGISQDKNGYIWISTHNGLFKYDGYRFKHYQHDSTNPNSPSSNFLIFNCVARDGSIWITSDVGIEQFDPNTKIFIHYRHNDKDSTSLSCDVARVVYEDREGTIWVGTGGLFDWDTKTPND